MPYFLSSSSFNDVGPMFGILLKYGNALSATQAYEAIAPGTLFLPAHVCTPSFICTCTKTKHFSTSKSNIKRIQKFSLNNENANLVP